MIQLSGSFSKFIHLRSLREFPSCFQMQMKTTGRPSGQRLLWYENYTGFPSCCVNSAIFAASLAEFIRQWNNKIKASKRLSDLMAFYPSCNRNKNVPKFHFREILLGTVGSWSYPPISCSTWSMMPILSPLHVMSFPFCSCYVWSRSVSWVYFRERHETSQTLANKATKQNSAFFALQSGCLLLQLL